MNRRLNHVNKTYRLLRPRVIVVVCFIIAAGLLVFDRPSSRPPALIKARKTTEGIFAPVLQIASAPFRALRSFGSGLSVYFRAVEENKRLRKDVVELKDWRNKALAMEEKLKAYEKLLSTGAEAPGTRIAARSLAESTGPFVHSRLINVGTEQGVRNGYAVLNIGGLLGRVIRTGRRSARVLVLTDLNSRIPVMSVKNETNAIMIGDNSSTPLFQHADPHALLSEGETLLTSGDDGVLPRGLPVGTLVRDAEGQWRVALFSKRTSVDRVWVYPFTPPIPPGSLDQDTQSDNKPGEGL